MSSPRFFRPLLTRLGLNAAVLLFVPALAVFARGEDAPPGLEVQLKSGQMLRGTFDPSSSDSHLVVASGSAGIVIRRRASWEQIESVTQAGREVGRAALARRVSSKASAPTRPTTIVMNTLAAIESPPPQRLTRPAQVASIAIDPRVANWDGDVETDGLMLDIAPLDAEGNVVPANAVAEVELFAPQRRDFSLAPLSSGDTVELVERWTQPIDEKHYCASGARIRLPFGAVHPELHPEWTASWYGLVHVRLVVPGHGVFEDSRDGVRIRPWAPNRDRLEHKTGQRFLPTERLGRTD